MDSDFFLPHVLAILNGRRVVPYTITDVSGVVDPTLTEFVQSRLAWVTAITGTQFPEDNLNPFLTIQRVNTIPYKKSYVEGLAEASPEGLRISVRKNPVPLDTAAAFVVVHEIGHVLGLSHPYGDGHHPTANNDVTIMSGTRPSIFSALRTTFSPLDVQHLQQAAGTAGDVIIGTPGPDRLSGNDLPNVIYGGSGPDRIRGRGGADWLHGGSGQDTFILDRPLTPYGYDVIEDFGKRDVLLPRAMNPDKIRFTFEHDAALVSYRGTPVAFVPNAPFLSDIHLG